MDDIGLHRYVGNMRMISDFTDMLAIWGWYRTSQICWQYEDDIGFHRYVGNMRMISNFTDMLAIYGWYRTSQICWQYEDDLGFHRYVGNMRMLSNFDQTLVNSLHGLSNCEIGGLDCHIITTEYRTRVHCIHMYHLFCNALFHVIYSGVCGQCSHTISNKYTHLSMLSTPYLRQLSDKADVYGSIWHWKVKFITKCIPYSDVCILLFMYDVDITRG